MSLEISMSLYFTEVRFFFFFYNLLKYLATFGAIFIQKEKKSNCMKYNKIKHHDELKSGLSPFEMSFIFNPPQG